MSLVFKTIQTEGIAELSYLVGDDDEGVAAVFDPRADCDVYIEAARRRRRHHHAHFRNPYSCRSGERLARTVRAIGNGKDLRQRRGRRRVRF